MLAALLHLNAKQTFATLVAHESTDGVANPQQFVYIVKFTSPTHRYRGLTLARRARYCGQESIGFRDASAFTWPATSSPAGR